MINCVEPWEVIVFRIIFWNQTQGRYRFRRKLNTVKASARTYLQKKGKHGGVDQSGALFDALM